MKLRATSRGAVALDRLGPGRTVVYVYPLSGRPGVALPEGWDAIPGARGCTAEACGFRDHHRELAEAGAAAVYGLSAQDTEYQRELVERLHLPFEMLSDERLRLADALGLPTFETGGMRLYRRLTMVIRDGAIEHVFFPVDAPGEHAEEVLTWLRRRTSGTDGEAPRRRRLRSSSSTASTSSMPSVRSRCRRWRGPAGPPSTWGSWPALRSGS